MHLNATLPSYPHCFSPAPTTFPDEAPKVVSKVWFLLAQLSGFSLPYKQSTPSLGPPGTHVYPFLGRKLLFREKGQGLVLGSGTFTQENPSGRGTSCVISHRMSLVSQEEPARALQQDCAMPSAELGSKSLRK